MQFLVEFGIIKKILDLDYEEDSDAETDGNFILTASNGIVELQTTAEKTFQ